MNQKVLIVDDEPDIRELLEITLSRMNIDCSSAEDLSSARALLDKEDFHLCLTDMRLPDGDGIDLVKDIQKNHPHIPVAIITAHGSTETAIKSLKSGAFDFVSKPINLTKLRALVGSALKLKHELSNTDSAELKIIGESTQLMALKDQITKVARSQAPAFINGESGSGKELVARAIHASGPRKDKDFIAINCGAIPSELMESEFFGHTKGSFTGADQNKIGLFQAADGGSLFLDEIADLPLLMQVKLLRAIQEKSIRPLGSINEVPIDVRIISATHKNLAEEVDAGRLRQDLYYRVNVIELKVPSLKARKSDIPLLCEHILNNIAKESGLSNIPITPHALQQLQNYDFPGNIRELENLLQRALALTDNNQINEIDFPSNLASQVQLTDDTTTLNEVSKEESITAVKASHTDGLTNVSSSLPAEGSTLEEHLENIEREAIKAALQECRWNKTAAAKKLGMSFRSFRYRLKKLGLD